MNFARKDYSRRIIDTENKIPEDEPVFLLRGQDQLAPKLLLMWAMELRLKGGDPTMAESAENHAQAMIKWQKDHGVKTPDMYEDTGRRFSKASIHNMLAELQADPTCYNSMAGKLMDMLKSYYGSDKPPFLMLMPMDLLPSAKDKKISEVDYFDIDFSKVEYKDYKLILFHAGGNTYIVKNEI